MKQWDEPPTKLGRERRVFHVEQFAKELLAERLFRDAETMGVSLGEASASSMVAHLRLTLERSATLNLTAVEDPWEALGIHVLDSLSAVSPLEGSPPGRFADLGSGGGFPGIPLSLATGRHGVLIESLGKKATFLREAVSVAEADCSVVHARAEEYAINGPELAAVVCRAVAELPVLLELAAPLLKMGGRLIAFKGRLTHEEAERGRRAQEPTGMTLEELRPVIVPGIRGARVLVVVRKASAPAVQLPRRPGLAGKRPLA